MENNEPLVPLREEEKQKSYFNLENKLAPRPAQPPITILPKPLLKPFPAPIIPPSGALSGVPSPQEQSWGAVISIIIIVLMIVIGAFYAWGKRIAEENALIAPTTSE